MAGVTILMGTFNGEAFLRRQLDTFAVQTFNDWKLVASDDGSTDRTQEILSEFRQGLGPSRVEIRNGPRRGFSANYLSLACDPTFINDYYAFSDQDDEWHADKLSRAVAWLTQWPANVPALYCGRTQLINQEGQAFGFSPLFRHSLSFRNALVQSIAGGNTMVFNEAARKLVKVGGNTAHVPSHDWWLYLLITAVGGNICYDPIPSIGYRVHSTNVVGSNVGWSSNLTRLKKLADGQFRRWTDLHVAALEPIRPMMVPENRTLFDLFSDSRQRGFFRRQTGLLKTAVYRQTFRGNLGLIAAICTGKI